MPSLKQLNEAVLAFVAEHPDALITVVVDATFGHRIDPKEVPEFDEAVDNNELVAPPAGAIGRGDAFVLSIANKVGATILSNDSYQEFHGQYEWLFEPGRLIGGKPVPHVGWVFVDRVPVRGPISRRSSREAKGKRPGTARPPTVRTGSKDASAPMPVPKAPPPGARVGGKAEAVPVAAATVAPAAAASAAAGDSAAQRSSAPVNDVLPFLSFVEHHPMGSSVATVVESYSSHGAYVRIGEVRGYLPLRLISDPPPRSAREVVKLGESVTLVVASFAPARRSIDLAMPDMAASVAAPASEASPAPKRASKRGAKKSAAPEVARDAASGDGQAPLHALAADTAAVPVPLDAATVADDAAAARGTEPAPAAARVRKAAAKRPSRKAAAASTAPVAAPADQAGVAGDTSTPAKAANAAKRATKKSTAAAPTLVADGDAVAPPEAATRPATPRRPAKKAAAASGGAARTTRATKQRPAVDGTPVAEPVNDVPAAPSRAPRRRAAR